MEGNSFFRAKITPRLMSDFIFDLQRFAFNLTEQVKGDSHVFSVKKNDETYYGTANQFTADNLIGDDITEINLFGDVTLSSNIGSEATTNTSNVLTATTAVKQTIKVTENVQLDLNGHFLTSSATTGIEIVDGKKFTLTDNTSEKNGVIYNTALASRDQNFAIKVGSSKVNSNEAEFDMLGGTIKSNSTGILGRDNGKVSVKDSTVESQNSCAVYFFVKSSEGYTASNSIGSTATIDNSTLKSNGVYSAIQVSGNITGKSVALDIKNGSTIYYNGSADGKNKDAIYCGGNADITISGETTKIVSKRVGIELRAGSLTVNSGKIAGNSQIDDTGNIEYIEDVSSIKYYSTLKGATFQDGVAVAVAQHTTQQNIIVDIEGGEISGYTAFAIANPNKHGTFDSVANNDAKTGGVSGGGVLKDGQLVVGTISVTVKNAKLKSTAAPSTVDNVTLQDEDSTKNVYTLTGKNSIINLDPRVNISLSNDTIEGSVLSVDSDGKNTREENSTGYEILDGNEFSNFTYDETESEKLVSYYEIPSNSDTFKPKVLGGNKGWNTQKDSENSFVYLVKGSTDTDNQVATLSPAVASEVTSTTDLKLTTANSGTATIPLNLTAKMFESLPLTFKTLDASSANSTFALNITGNDTIREIKSGAGNDTLRAGAKGVTLDGGAGADSLVGGKGDDTFIYSSGEDTITEYSINDDIVSLATGITPITDTTKIESLSTGLKLTFEGDNKTLTFVDKSAVYAVSIKSDESNTYYYTPDLILHNGTSISLGAGYASLFNSGNYDGLKTIDASKVSKEIRIIGNELDNYIIGGASGSIFGGYGSDTLQAGASGATLNGGEGNDSLIGGDGKDLFVFSKGADSIKGYTANDLVSVASDIVPEDATVSVSNTNNLVIDFGGNDKITFEDGADSTISLTSGDRDMYLFKKNQIAHYSYDRNNDLKSKSVSLTSGYDQQLFNDEEGNYDIINASEVTNGISLLSGSNENTTIIGSNKGGTLGGGAGNDRLDVNDRDNDSNYTFVYTAGKDTIFGFEEGDSVSLTAESITSAKNGNGRFTFTIKANKNVLTLNGEDVDKVNLTGGNYLTANGLVDTAAGSLKLFTSANGTIDLTDDPYNGSTIESINAESVKAQSVNLVASSSVRNVTFASRNKMKDIFTYGGGSVAITNYEVGKDKINLGDDGEIKGFTVAGNNVEISVGGYTGDSNKVTLIGVAGEEILVHHADSKSSNSYEKMIFKVDNVLFNKDSRATSATIRSGAKDFAVGTTGDIPKTIKKITVESGVNNISITAGDSNNTNIDASASDGVTLIGGKKNDKLIGSTDSGDIFVYGSADAFGKAGKDVIQNYFGGDKVILQEQSGFAVDKIKKVSASNTSVKLTFDSSNTLTIKGTKESDFGTINIADSIVSGGENYTFKKNAIIGSSGVASLTTEASGTFKLDKLDVATVTAANVEKKNLTLTGTDGDEKLIGGGKKTTFKGGGGKDTLVGGSGADTFVYAKGNQGDVTIENFDFAKDNLKIANGTITSISTVDGGVKFFMNNGRKDSENIGSFIVTSNVTSNGSGEAINPDKIVLKANNTYYWFASGGEEIFNSTDKAKVGQLITASGAKKTDFDSSFNVIDLGYSTNLVKSTVAIKVKDRHTASSGS